MDFQCKNLTSPSAKNKYKNTVERYKSDVKSLRRDFERDREVAQRSELFNGRDPNVCFKKKPF